MNSSQLSSFFRKIAPSLSEMEAIPLFGHAPIFDWRKYAGLLAARLLEESFSIHLKKQEWKESAHVIEGLGSNPWITPVLLSPIPTPFYWAMSLADAHGFCQSFLKADSETLQEGFYRYLLLEALDAAKELEPVQQLTPQLADDGHVPNENAFCIDLSVSIHQETYWGRLIIPRSTKDQWVAHFSHLPYAPVAMERSREIELTVGVQVGRFDIASEEWKGLHLGDAVILDRSSYDPRQEGGIATLMLGSVPLFQAKVEKNRITILEYAFYYEEPMEGEKRPENETGEMSAIQNYPISIAVELGRLRITLEQLMHLSAGNTLELPIQPDQGVALTVNGRLIGRGELVSFEGAMAVRITEMGS